MRREPQAAPQGQFENCCTSQAPSSEAAASHPDTSPLSISRLVSFPFSSLLFSYRGGNPYPSGFRFARRVDGKCTEAHCGISRADSIRGPGQLTRMAELSRRHEQCTPVAAAVCKSAAMGRGDPIEKADSAEKCCGGERDIARLLDESKGGLEGRGGAWRAMHEQRGGSRYCVPVGGSREWCAACATSTSTLEARHRSDAARAETCRCERLGLRTCSAGTRAHALVMVEREQRRGESPSLDEGVRSRRGRPRGGRRAASAGGVDVGLLGLDREKKKSARAAQKKPRVRAGAATASTRDDGVALRRTKPTRCGARRLRDRGVVFRLEETRKAAHARCGVDWGESAQRGAIVPAGRSGSTAQRERWSHGLARWGVGGNGPRGGRPPSRGARAGDLRGHTEWRGRGARMARQGSELRLRCRNPAAATAACNAEVYPLSEDSGLTGFGESASRMAVTGDPDTGVTAEVGKGGDIAACAAEGTLGALHGRTRDGAASWARLCDVKTLRLCTQRSSVTTSSRLRWAPGRSLSSLWPTAIADRELDVSCRRRLVGQSRVPEVKAKFMARESGLEEWRVAPKHGVTRLGSFNVSRTILNSMALTSNNAEEAGAHTTVYAPSEI
ncbi:hypothetical protein K438DRAFT_1752442 [Mycena galopus ATCC 62051]|nr:hypothetical protein K438DRAFT_1752442 [Mycena galopus ATCC 62051]